DWFYLPQWERSAAGAARKTEPKGPCWAFVDGRPAGQVEGGEHRRFGDLLLDRLRARGEEVCRIEPGPTFERQGATWKLDPRRREHYELLVKDLTQLGKQPGRILHLWGLTPAGDQEDGSLDSVLDLGFHSLVYLAQALGPRIRGSTAGDAVELSVVTRGVYAVTGEESLRPEWATVVGPIRVVPVEYPTLVCRHLDLTLPESGSRQEELLLDRLLEELSSPPEHRVVAYRGAQRMVRNFKRQPLEMAPAAGGKLRRDGVYLITGGLGGIGLAIASHLA
ncbi:MAG: polyketide synthase, partial [bacterium]|nr:polyketide synthase [bacterium]